MLEDDLRSTRSQPLEQPATTTARRLAYRLRGLSKHDRAYVAAGLVGGRITALTERAAARVCGASVYQIRRELGKCNLAPSLAEVLVNSTADERAAAAKRLGVDVIWGEMILPLLDTAATAAE